MSWLVCLYASNLLKIDVIKVAENNLSTLNLASGGQLADENLGIGDDTWVLIAQLEGKADPRPFYRPVRQFHV